MMLNVLTGLIPHRVVKAQNDNNDKVYVSISKIDENSYLLSGTKLKVTDSQNKETIIEEWKSTEEPNIVDCKYKEFSLTPGKYKFVKTLENNSIYTKAKDISFSILSSGKLEMDKDNYSRSKYDQDSKTITMVNEYLEHDVKFSKQDIVGKELEGVTIELWRNGEKIDSWTSGKTAKELSLRAGTYTMIEKSAPKGYKVSTSITFTVTEDMKIEDVKVRGQNKVDAEGKLVVMIDEFIEETKGETRR